MRKSRVHMSGREQVLTLLGVNCGKVCGESGVGTEKRTLGRVADEDPHSPLFLEVQ